MTFMSRLMTGAGLLALSTGFAAAAPATVRNDLNLRSGPGPDYDVIAAMPAGSTVNVMGCEASWCRVAFGDTVGFASRGYLGLGGPVAAAPGYDEDSYASGGYSPGYTSGGYSGTPAYGQSYGYYEGERSFGNQRRFGEQTTIERRSGERGAARAQGLNDNANARSSERASEVQGVNPMLNAKDEPPAGASGNARAEARGSASQRRGAANVSEGANARATTGAGGGDDHGPNFIGGGKSKVDNHP
jgi:uncharacterized protein YraI